jgi:hypothetical protein
MADETRFKKGDFKTFKASHQIHLGAIAQTIEEGETIKYDGETLELRGEKHDIGTLRAAIKAGWLISPSQSKRIEADMRFVRRTGKVVTDALEGKSKKSFKVGAFVQESGDQKVIGSIKNRSGAIIGNKPKETTVETSALQEGITVGKVGTPLKINTPLKTRTILADEQVVAHEIRKIENIKPKKDILTQPQEKVVGAEEAVEAAPEKVDRRRLRKKKNQEIPIGDNLTWDKTTHWRTRARKAVKEYADNEAVLAKIMEVECASVVKAIKKKMG